MLINKNIFSVTCMHHTKKRLQVNKPKNFFKFLETLKTKTQATVKLIIAEAAAFCFCRCRGLR